MFVRPDHKMTFGLTYVSAIASTARKFINYHGIHLSWYRSLKGKLFLNLFGDENTIFSRIPGAHSRKMLRRFFFIRNEILPRKIRGIVTSFFLAESSDEGFFLTNKLSKTFLMHRSMKYRGNLFFCHMVLRREISSWIL